jgi:hypothetical protein
MMLDLDLNYLYLAGQSSIVRGLYNIVNELFVCLLCYRICFGPVGLDAIYAQQHCPASSCAG